MIPKVFIPSLTGVSLSVALLAMSMQARLFASSAKKDIELGAAVAEEIEQQIGLYTSAPEAAVYLNAVGTRLASVANDSRWTFKFQILDQEEPNAFAIPGGGIYVSRGLLALINNEDELAGVLAHEIAHVTERHSAKQQRTGLLPGLLSLPGNLIGTVSSGLGALINVPMDAVGGAVASRYSRGQEKDADRLGIRIAAEGGYDGEALAEILQRMEKVVNSENGKARKFSIFDSHPMTDTRLKDIRTRAANLKRKSSKPVATDKVALFFKVDGLWWAENPEQGVIRKDSFLQPAVGFAIDLPAGWTNRNTPMYVISIEPKQNALEMLSIADAATDPEVLGKRFIAQMKKAGRVVPISAEKKIVGQFPAFVATYREKSGREESYLEMTWVTMNTNSFQVLSFGAAKNLEATRASIATLRLLNEEERQTVTAKRLRVVVAQPGEDLSAVSRRTGNIWSPEFTALVNGLTSHARLDSGQVIKIAREETWNPRPNALSGRD